jgi:hypothetical protein
LLDSTYSAAINADLSVYGCALDNFGLGCIVAEMCRQRPLFAGRNEMDQLTRIFALTGTPASPHQSWSDGVQWMHKLGLQQPPTSLQQLHEGGPRDKLEQFLLSGASTADNIATRDARIS